jgi:hypothetical protein
MLHILKLYSVIYSSINMCSKLFDCSCCEYVYFIPVLYIRYVSWYDLLPGWNIALHCLINNFFVQRMLYLLLHCHDTQISHIFHSASMKMHFLGFILTTMYTIIWVPETLPLHLSTSVIIFHEHDSDLVGGGTKGCRRKPKTQLWWYWAEIFRFLRQCISSIGYVNI